MTDKTMLTTAEAANYLGLSARTLGANWYRWGLKPYRVGRRNMYRVCDIEKFLAASRISEPRRVA